MAVSCDLRVAAEDAHLQMNEVTLGGIGGWDMGIRERLPIGVSHEISLLGGVLSGRRAYELGIVNRAVPKDRLMDTAHELAERLLGMPPQALRTMKRAMQAEAPRASGRGIEIDLNSRERLGKAADTLEAVRAFNEKRKPVFTGQ
jgi:enoyl-CoA hydratase/carnithine racemase